MKQVEKKENKSKLAKGIDYFTVRITIFVLATITFSQLGIQFYGSVILAILSTVIINRQVNSYKQKRLTRMAKEKSKKDLATVAQGENQEQVPVNALKPFNFLMSALFLFGLGFVFTGWFKYYFYIFSLINVVLAIFTLIKLRRVSATIKEESN